MEDEEGYMTLKPRTRKEASTHCSRVQRTEDVTRWPKQSKILVGILGAVCVSLGLALIWMTVLAFQIKQPVNNQEKACVSERPTNCTDQKCNLFEFRRTMCDALNSGLAGGSKCLLCPVNWKLQKGKCFWFSEGEKGWFEAYSDCAGKRAQMLVERDLKTVESTRGIRVWIGLNFTSPGKKWTWVDGSLAAPDSIAGASSTAETGCGIFNGHQIQPEICNDLFQWVCQKEAVLF